MKKNITFQAPHIPDSDQRQQLLYQWAQTQVIRLLEQTALADPIELIWSMVSGDASFRRYFRLSHSQKSWILVDAPPEHENNPQFVTVANMLQKLNAPRVLAYDFEQGLMLLSDLGDQLYLPLLNADSADSLYQAAIDSLVEMQNIDQAEQLPAYDSALLNLEMELFRDWFLGRHLQYQLSEQEHALLDQTFAILTQNAIEQPQVFVHRDYHSRNIMFVEDEHGIAQTPGIIDFQDAVYGPISYDLLSLLRDCYIKWPAQKVQQWVDYFIEESPHQLEKSQFNQWFDYMGLQRHIKVAGIFARLYYRDGKAGYLKDIPLTLTYILEQARDYPELHEFYTWMTQTIMPRFEQIAQQNTQQSTNSGSH
ncbi:MAG: phosphotransferase [Kangiellaceae bacterium]|nr:phosphotransferase [Kangiellaceae bacterium]